jgi:hypothetical protein
MSHSHSTEDDLLPKDEEDAQKRLIRFSHWRDIRPAFLREDRHEPMPSDDTALFFGDILCKKFEKALHQAFALPSDADPRDRAVRREALAQVPRPLSWMETWPDFWDFFTRERPQSKPRLNSLFGGWPWMDKMEADEIMAAWEAGARTDSLATYSKITDLGVNVQRTVNSMEARLNLPFKDLARDWCKNLGLTSQITSGSKVVSTEEKTSGGSDEDGLSFGDKLEDPNAENSAEETGLRDLRQVLKLLPHAFFEDMTGKERAIVALRLFGVPLYKSPVSDCPHIEPPRGRDALYKHTFDAVMNRLQQKALQIVSDPIVQKRQKPSALSDDKDTAGIVAGILEKDIRRILCAWLGHPDGKGVILSEKAPSWLFEMLNETKPHWQTINFNDLTQEP